MKTQTMSMLDLEQDTQLRMAERDWEYKMMWDELKYGKFAEAATHADNYTALAATIAYAIESN